jgi:hypothetical protein
VFVKRNKRQSKDKALANSFFRNEEAVCQGFFVFLKKILKKFKKLF